MANFPLVITSPRASLTANTRPRRAYPGLEFNIRITAVGGDWPHVYSINNQPSGMVVNSSTGVISWPNPVLGTYTNIGVAVSDGTLSDSQTFTLTVTTSGFQFIDAVNGSGAGTGTLANPWQTLLQMYNSGAADAVTYLRAGTYLCTGLPTSTGVPTDLENRVSWDQTRSVIWLAFPGETPVVDFEHDGTFCTGNQGIGYTCIGVRQTPRFRFSGHAVWIDGITFRRVFIMALHLFADAGFLGWVVRRCTFESGGPGAEGSNGSYIMGARTNSTHKYGSYFGENTCLHPYFGAVNQLIDAVKTYDEQYLLVAENTFNDQTIFGADGAIAIKGHHNRWEVRGNTITNWVGAGIGGNQDGAGNGEIRFNNVSVSGVEPSTGVAALAIHVGQGPGLTQNNFVYRNTIQGGRLRVWYGNPSVGPTTVNNNAIQNGDGGQLTPFICDGPPAFNPGSQQWSDCGGVVDTSMLIISNNLGAASGIVDSSGNLLNPANIGIYGHMLGVAPVPPPTVNMRYARMRSR